jgi:hypothetical protein
LASVNRNLTRRKLARRVLGILAVGGASTLLLGGRFREAEAVDGTFDNLVVDNSQANSGALTPGVQLGGGSSGEGIASRRTSGGNVDGLDLFTAFQSRVSINQAGRVGIGTGNPQAILHVVGSLNGEVDGPNIIVGISGNGLSVSGIVGGTIAGGGRPSELQSITGSYGTIGGGLSNTATSGGTVAGGRSNTAGILSAVGGGYVNQAPGVEATVGGGFQNIADNSSSTVGGGNTNTANGAYSTIPGGYFNSALGDRSFAAGTRAYVEVAHHGAMLFSDDTYATSGVLFKSAAADEFAVRATAGFRFVTGIDTSGNVTSIASVNASGSLGVRTGAPSYALDVHSSGSSSSQLHITPTGLDSGGYLTSANPGNLFMSAGAAWNGSAWIAKSSTAYQYGGGTAGVRFFFDTGLTVGGTYTPSTRMFIGPTGNVGIGMSTQPGHLLQLGLDDAAKPSTSSWTIASDGRLKDPESIEPFTEGLDFVERLPQPVWFRYRRDSGLPSDRRVVGWVAQDVARVAPFMVRRTRQRLHESDVEETETLSLNTNELPYALVNSIKQLVRKQRKLEAKNSALGEENEKCRDEIKSLRSRIQTLERTRRSQAS